MAYQPRIVDEELGKRLAAQGAITGSGYGYVRNDGIHVIPVGALKP